MRFVTRRQRVTAPPAPAWSAIHTTEAAVSTPAASTPPGAVACPGPARTPRPASTTVETSILPRARAWPAAARARTAAASRTAIAGYSAPIPPIARTTAGTTTRPPARARSAIQTRPESTPAASSSTAVERARYWVVRKPCAAANDELRLANVATSWASTQRRVSGPKGLPLPRLMVVLPAPALSRWWGCRSRSAVFVERRGYTSIRFQDAPQVQGRGGPEQGQLTYLQSRTVSADRRQRRR